MYLNLFLTQGIDGDRLGILGIALNAAVGLLSVETNLILREISSILNNQHEL